MTNPRPLRLNAWILLIPLGAIVLNFAFFPKYSGDDSFIHFTYARNIIERGIVAYNGYSPSYGATSILWVLLGAFVSWVWGDVPQAMRLAGALLFASSIFLAVAAVHRRNPISLPAQILVAVFFTANAALFRWMLTGMETGLVCLITILCLLLINRHRPVVTAILCLAAFLVRPEFFLFPVCILMALAFEKPFERRFALTFSAACVLLFGTWFVVAGMYFGRLMPMTSIKSVGWFDLPSTGRIAAVSLGAFPAIVVASLLLLRRGGLKEAKTMLRTVDRAFLLFGVALLGFYVLRGTNVISRYLMVLYLPLAFLCVLGISRRWMAGGRTGWQAVAIVALALCIESATFLIFHAPHMRSFVSGFQQAYTDMGKLIEERDPADSGSVMVADVGIIGYYSRRPVIDLAGLTSAHIYEAGTIQDSALLARYHPRFVVIRDVPSRIQDYRAMVERIASDSHAVRSVYTSRIPPLRVMSDPAQWWQVELLEVTYAGVEPAPPPVMGNAADPPNRPAD
jgi:hypothetical protein